MNNVSLKLIKIIKLIKYSDKKMISDLNNIINSTKKYYDDIVNNIQFDMFEKEKQLSNHISLRDSNGNIQFVHSLLKINVDGKIEIILKNEGFYFTGANLKFDLTEENIFNILKTNYILSKDSNIKNTDFKRIEYYGYANAIKAFAQYISKK